MNYLQLILVAMVGTVLGILLMKYFWLIVALVVLGLIIYYFLPKAPSKKNEID